MAAADDLDDLVRRVDPDRWLSSRFIADPIARADLVTLYAFDHELARAGVVASNPIIAEIRLVWWREVLDEIFEGRPVRAHPTARALAEMVRRRGLERVPLDDMVEGRILALDGGSLGVERAGRGVVLTAAAILRPSPLAGEGGPKGRMRDRRDSSDSSPPGATRASEFSATPHPPPSPGPPSPAREEGTLRELGALWARVISGRTQPPAPDLRARLDSARRQSGTIPAAQFPAVLHLALAGPELRGRRPSGLNARLRLVWASLTGRL